jgi:hypothetical protein
MYEEFKWNFDHTKIASKSITFELYDEDSTFKQDKNDYVGNAKIENIDEYKNKKKKLNLIVKKNKKDTGQIIIEVEWKQQKNVKEEEEVFALNLVINFF